MERIFPRSLRKGDTIGIVAPCWEMKPERLEAPVKTLEKMGYRVRFARNLFSSANEFAGSVEERAKDFNDMIADPEVKAVLFGGGEVGNEILPYIDYRQIVCHPKILSSYSDGTTILNAVHSQTGLITFYGASPRTFGEAVDYNLRSFEKRTGSFDRIYEKSGDWKVICPGKCQGTLTGGYLVNYAALYGLPYFKRPNNKRYVLFIEDHKMFSSPAVVSKWFANLEMYGGFENVAGLIFGHYAEEEYPVIDDILRRLGEKHRIPVVRCDDFGHGTYASTLPIGIECAMDTETGTFTLLESAVSE